MYHTDGEVATHEEPWASIIRIGLRETCDRICGHLADSRDPEEFSSDVFNRLTPAQKVGMLATVGSALLDPAVPQPELTAVVESTTATILDVFVSELEVEADTNGYEQARAQDGLPPYTTCRSLLRELLEEYQDDSEPEPLPDVLSTDHKEWTHQADILYSLVFFDYDFEDEELYVDSPPETSDLIKEMLTIDPEYFTELAPEPTRDEIRKHLETLERLTRSKLDEGFVLD